MKEHYFMKPYWIKINGWAGDMYRASDVDEKIAQLNDTILRLEALVPNYNEEITRLVNEMNLPEIKEMFYRYMQEGENLKGDFTKAEKFIGTIETICSMSFKKENEQSYLLDWTNEIKTYRNSLDKLRKVWANHKDMPKDDIIEESL